MKVLSNYNEFGGRLWELGVLRNALAYHFKTTAPGEESPSEALLLGISGGAAFGYWIFEYQGLAPQVNLVTRNSFDPFEKIVGRLGIQTKVQQTGSEKKAVENLDAVLDSGRPALVWADMYALPYNNLADQANEMWAMLPIIIFGHGTDDEVHVADRADVSLTMSNTELTAARGRTAKNKYRLLAIQDIDLARVPEAVRSGLEDCIQLYLGQPPRGPATNWGFSGLEKWAGELARSKGGSSWAKRFPPGERLYSGLMTAFQSLAIRSGDGLADRALFAEFLGEAAHLLNLQDLHSAAGVFRRSASLWGDLAAALLPDGVEPLAETRHLIEREHHIFLAQGNRSLPERQEIKNQLAEIKTNVSASFPLDASAAGILFQELAERVQTILECEQQAMSIMQEALS